MPSPPIRTQVDAGMKSVLVHGLTGGIASGKTHACSVLRGLGATVLNADLLAHACYAPHTPANQQLRKAFGPSIFTTDGRVDRKKLGKLVFQRDHRSLQQLNKIMFPATEARAKEEIARLTTEGHAWVVVEAAVLVEAGWDLWMDEVWTMLIDPKLAQARLMDRDGMTAEEAQRRIAALASNEVRNKAATLLIDSSGSKEQTAAKLRVAAKDLKRRVKDVHNLDLPLTI